ncbi:SRPBCC domain-containing protein [bacterium]|nr:MAG: SRPBCC domain-containing protein [bacterium]
MADILLERTFDAPRDLVFRAWTDPEQLVQWFAPRGCSIEFERIDPREGGSFHSCIRTPVGPDCWCVGTYLEIMPPERLAFTMRLADADGNPLDSEGAGKDSEWPEETTITVTLTEDSGRTHMTLHQNAPEEIARRTGAYGSWIEMFDRLAESLPTRTSA